MATTTSDGKESPGLDVVELVLTSDGTDLTATATLKNKQGKRANTVIELQIDTDNNLKTGGKSMFLDTGGFERQVDLNACVDYGDSMNACIGEFDRAVKNHFAVANVHLYTGKDSTTERGAFGDRSPSDGKVIRAKVKYTDLGVKPGQTIRIAAREGDAGLDIGAWFPEVLLTLK